jgi:hypothetical protein
VTPPCSIRPRWACPGEELPLLHFSRTGAPRRAHHLDAPPHSQNPPSVGSSPTGGNHVVLLPPFCR